MSSGEPRWSTGLVFHFPMTQHNESSVLFSLKELMTLEEDRVRQESDALGRAEAAAWQARQAEEARLHAEAEARLRAQDEARRQEEQRAREEQARLDAIRHGELERARLDAENRARMETLARQQAFEKELHALSHDKSKKNLKLVVGLTLGALLLVGGGAGALIYDANLKQQQLTAQLNDLNGQIAASDKKVKDLNDQLALATSDAERSRINSEIAQAEADRRRAAEERDKKEKDGKRTAPAVTATGNAVTIKAPQCHMITDGTKVKSCAAGDGLCVCD